MGRSPGVTGVTHTVIGVGEGQPASVGPLVTLGVSSVSPRGVTDWG
jgi:hypothetical protein